MQIKKIKPWQICLIVVAAVFVIALVAGGIYCGVNNETPSQMFEDIVTPDEDQLIGKWQGEKAITGYEFFDDGTYESYLLGFSTQKYYEVSGNKITLKSGSDNKRVIYKFKINGDKMTMTLVESEGKKVQSEESQIYKKVEHFNFKSLTESIQDLADELNEDEESTDEATEKE